MTCPVDGSRQCDPLCSGCRGEERPRRADPAGPRHLYMLAYSPSGWWSVEAWEGNQLVFDFNGDLDVCLSWVKRLEEGTTPR